VLSRSRGRWHICFSDETPDAYGPHPLQAVVDIDVDLTSLIGTSDNNTVPTPK
jgi:putative transposase